MKKVISLLLIAAIVCSFGITVFATNDYTQGTQVVYNGTGAESYTITVPAALKPGQSGAVTLSGTWAENRTITVTADATVTLTNSINANDKKVLDVTFNGISEKGSNIGSQTFTETVSVQEITDALFGTWDGTFYYNVEMKDADELKYEMVYKPSGETTEVLNGIRLCSRTVVPLSSINPSLFEGDTYQAVDGYFAEVTNLSAPVIEQIMIDLFTVNHGTESWVVVDSSLNGLPVRDLTNFAVKCYYPSSIAYHDFEMVERTVNGETILVPTMTNDEFVDGQVIREGKKYSMWVYNPETMTFSLGTGDTTLYDGMICYADYAGVLWQIATGETWTY